jgi:hypothetical protein
LTTGDFNGDGIEDLAVGGPGYTFNNMPQRGVVQIYFGNKNTKKCTLLLIKFLLKTTKFKKIH